MIPNAMLTGDQLIRLSDDRRRRLAAQWGHRHRAAAAEPLRPSDYPATGTAAPAPAPDVAPVTGQPVPRREVPEPADAPVAGPSALVSGRC